MLIWCMNKWIPKLYKSPYEQRYIADSSKFCTKPLSLFLTKILTVTKEKLIRKKNY